MSPAAPVVMVVDDDIGSVRLAEEAFRETRPDIVFHAVVSGTHALEYLARLVAGDQRLPDLVLLDLNMPGMHGHEVLERLKADDRFHGIPVVIFTSSGSDTDRSASLQRRADGFLTKASTYERLLDDVRGLLETYVGRRSG